MVCTASLGMICRRVFCTASLDFWRWWAVTPDITILKYSTTSTRLLSRQGNDMKEVSMDSDESRSIGSMKWAASFRTQKPLSCYCSYPRTIETTSSMELFCRQFLLERRDNTWDPLYGICFVTLLGQTRAIMLINLVLLPKATKTNSINECYLQTMLN